MAAAENGEYCVKSLKMQAHTAGSRLHAPICDVEVLGCSAKPVWHRDETGLHIRTEYKTEGPITFKVKLV
jgi:alpha-L-fucosidase